MDTARKTWELDNNVELVDPHRDNLYTYDSAEQKALGDAKPWKTDPHHFKNVRISAVALLKMVMHARSGGSIEVMGLMQGKIAGDTIIVTDAFRLPVEGTETRVNAQDEANEYMVGYLQACRDQGKLENAVGWYHSHPGYGCWLSGIDVSTQATQQTFSDPFLAVVIDPDRTISAGKVEIGAFRTYPENYKPIGSGADDGYQTIPLAKAEDFGAHASRYYSLEVSHFKSSLDTHLLELLWNKYWVQTLSQSPLFTNREYSSKQMLDLSSKIRQAGAAISRTGRQMTSMPNRATDQQLEKVVRDSNKIAGEEVTGLMAGEVKAKLFNGLGHVAKVEPAPETKVAAAES
ncbi:COP9 signalosome catalytic subunit rri1 [Cadophora gregata]|uniref:COP9 signalosome catalytic subunit rri1 n=1 Tax=Cadophora gregata TaxID=51156 RepID=UPI0026DDB4EC|nr:COP9 signalosome catalytic subunit rri1 [Cadophora gregata]KAK0125416.1 COP9 signalosome catalytic subunit rri1 [Cadophora gregata f. sp. sojae]KAK0128605.1 COP9 signalosome catalytic subunit rri1 [Cadophora gregata]